MGDNQADWFLLTRIGSSFADLRSVGARLARHQVTIINSPVRIGIVVVPARLLRLNERP